jgi:hypothetical protein
MVKGLISQLITSVITSPLRSPAHVLQRTQSMAIIIGYTITQIKHGDDQVDRGVFDGWPVH